MAGAEGVTEELEKRLQIKEGETTADDKYTLESVACLGCCSLAPVVAVDNQIRANVERSDAAGLIDTLEAENE